MRKRFPLLLVTAGVALFLAGFIWVYVAAAESASTPYAWGAGPAQVVGSMSTEVVGWDQGPHSSVACLQCHEEVDPQQLKDAYVAGDKIDLASWMAVAQQRCEECHAPQMKHLLQDRVPAPLHGSPTPEVGQPMAVKALHDKHINGKAATTCMDCHADSAHGPLSGTPEWRDATHSTCQDCHTEQQVTIPVAGSTSCGACHVDPGTVAPADHTNMAAFMGSHGRSEQNCAACHLSLSAGTSTKLSDPAFYLSSNEDTCVTCHQGMTMPHPVGFLSQHGHASLTAKAGTCESCHSPERSPVQPLPDHASPQFCADCHLVPMPHPASFMAGHGAEALQSPRVCANCHSSKNQANPGAPHTREDYCTACHNTYQHEAGWVASHGDQVDDSCTTCHSTHGEATTHNACASCHNSSGTWHPSMWFITHGRAVNTGGKEPCMACHAEVEPSCSKCHRNQ